MKFQLALHNTRALSSHLVSCYVMCWKCSSVSVSLEAVKHHHGNFNTRTPFGIYRHPKAYFIQDHTERVLEYTIAQLFEQLNCYPGVKKKLLWVLVILNQYYIVT